MIEVNYSGDRTLNFTGKKQKRGQEMTSFLPRHKNVTQASQINDAETLINKRSSRSRHKKMTHGQKRFFLHF